MAAAAEQLEVNHLLLEQIMDAKVVPLGKSQEHSDVGHSLKPEVSLVVGNSAVQQDNCKMQRWAYRQGL